MKSKRDRHADGGLAEPRRARQSILRILGLDEAEFDRLIQAMGDVDRRDFLDQIRRYQDVCTRMSDRYWHWGAHLQLEAAAGRTSEEPYRRSSLMSLYRPEDLAAIQARPALRQCYFDELGTHLAHPELRQYEAILSVGCLPGGSMPDILGAHLIQLLDVLFVFTADLVDVELRTGEGLVMSDTLPQEERAEYVGRMASIEAGMRVRGILDRIAPRSGAAPSKSLASMLMTSACLNRHELEDLEYERLERQVSDELVRMIAALRSRGMDTVPLSASRAEFGQWLMDAWGAEMPELAKGRQLKVFHLDRLFRRAEYVAEWIAGEPFGSLGHVEPSHVVAVLVLIMSWDYVAKVPHDPRLPGSRSAKDLVNGGEFTETSLLPGSILAHHRRELMTFINAGQLNGLSEAWVMAYHRSNAFRRMVRGDLRRMYLKGIGPQRWESLYRAVSDYVQEGLREIGMSQDAARDALSLPSRPVRYGSPRPE